MPVALQVIRASEFIRLDADEHLDFAASKQALQVLAHACHKRGLDRALMDLRSLPVLDRPHFTPTELAALVGTFREAGFTRQQRLAILYRHDVHGGIRSFAFISRLRGLQVRAFDEFEAAMQWLSEETTGPVTRRSQGVPVPIATSSGEVKKLPASSIAENLGRSAARKNGHKSAEPSKHPSAKKQVP